MAVWWRVVFGSGVVVRVEVMVVWFGGVSVMLVGVVDGLLGGGCGWGLFSWVEGSFSMLLVVL